MWNWLISTAHAAEEPTLTVSLSVLDHIANAAVALFTTLSVCGGFIVWLRKNRAAHRAGIMREVRALVTTEKTEREEDVAGAGDAIANLDERLERLVTAIGTCAKQSDVQNLYRLIEQQNRDAAAAHRDLAQLMTSQLGEIRQRVDRAFERRTTERG